jgi:N-acetylglucosamine kinase-like BadF-type ATPase
MRYVFGIDGGGTSSRLRMESLEGEPLFYAEGGGTNPNSRSRADIETGLAALFARSRDEAGLRPSDCVAGFAGSAGIDRPGDHGPYVSLLRAASGLVCPIEVGNDAEPALAGALGDTEGLLLIAGTGSIALGRSRDGFSVRAGGWGHLLGDEGSAWRIAFDAICRGLRSAEGRDLETGLLDAALDYFELPDPEALIPFVYGGFDKARVARFARVVASFRDRGDPLARDLFDKAARELAGLLESVYARVADRLERRRASFRGGLIEGDAGLRADLVRRLAERLPDLEIVEARADAAVGACLLARALAKGASAQGLGAGTDGP